MLHSRHWKLAMNTGWQHIYVCEGIKGQRLNVKSALNLHTQEIEFFMLVHWVIFSDPSSCVR
jgi:hypothetical protein